MDARRKRVCERRRTSCTLSITDSFAMKQTLRLCEKLGGVLGFKLLHKPYSRFYVFKAYGVVCGQADAAH